MDKRVIGLIAALAVAVLALSVSLGVVLATEDSPRNGRAASTPGPGAPTGSQTTAPYAPGMMGPGSMMSGNWRPTLDQMRSLMGAQDFSLMLKYMHAYALGTPVANDPGFDGMMRRYWDQWMRSVPRDQVEKYLTPTP